MTLIMSAGVGSYFTVMTADTRQVSMLGEKMLRYKDNENKVEFLTDYTLYGAGGSSWRAEEVRDRLREKVSAESDLNECKTALEQVVADMRDQLTNEIALQVMITGFCHDGHSGIVSYVSGEESAVEFKIFESYEFNRFVIAPTADHMHEIMNSFQLPEVQPEELPSVTVGYLSQVHEVVAQMQPETVSETCKYYVIAKDLETNELRHFSGDI
jgi:hypothetical protein